MSTRNLDHLFQPASIAIMDTRGQGSALSSVAARNLLKGGFKGDLAVVMADAREIEGISIYPGLASIPTVPDLAIVSTAPEELPNLLGELAARGTKAVIIMARGTEAITEGQIVHLNQAMLEASQPHQLRILGPDSLGVMTPRAGLNATLTDVQPLAGSLALVSESGSALTPILEWAVAHGIGFSHVVSLGEMVDIDVGDVLDYLAGDTDTRAVLLLLERFTRIRKFMSAARALTGNKPVIALKTGRFQKPAWCSTAPPTYPADTASLDEAVLWRAGIVQVTRIDDLLEALETFHTVRSPRGDRLAIVGNGSGIGALAADALSDAGGSLAELSPGSAERLRAAAAPGWSPGQPIDLGPAAQGSRYAEALEILLNDGGIDAVLALHAPTALSSSVETAQAVVAAVQPAAAKAKTPPVITAWLGDLSGSAARQLLTQHRIATYSSPERAVQGLMQMVHYRRLQDTLMQTVSPLPDDFAPDRARTRAIIDRGLDEGRESLTAEEAGGVLAAYGIPAAAAPQTGVAPMDRSHELLLAMLSEAEVGPVICFGQGGSAGDLVPDASLALPPLDLHLARQLIRRTRVGRLLEGDHTAPAADLDSIALTLVQLSQLVCDFDAIAEIEINPLQVSSQGVLAVDVSMRVTRPSPTVSPADRLAIRPYPRELEETLTLPDGHSILLRPIKPEDEPLYVELFAALSPEDIYMRFLNRMKTLPHHLAARLTQLDYDRDMALVLIGRHHSGKPELYGGARIMAAPDQERAEFAVLLRQDMTGLGLGPLLLRRIIDYAKGRGIVEVYGEVLSDNRPMLKLCQVFGFTAKRSLDDPGIMNLSLRL